MEIKGLLALIVLSALTWATCGPEPQTPPPASVEKPEDSLRLSEGQTVTVTGTFQGWQVANCRFPPDVASRGRTRGDWLIRTGADCLYVTGGLPSGLDPSNPEHIGRSLEIRAVVVRGEAGLYLDFRP